MKCLLLLLVSIYFLSCHQSNKPGINTQLDSLYQSSFPANEPGGAVLVAQNGKIIYENGFGLADIQTKEPITPKTLFNVGSISKTFVAYGILKLAREGKLSLDDDLDKYFPEFKNKEIAHKVKIFHLLTHSSGLPDSRKVSEDSVFYLTAKDKENFAPILETDSLHFEPGEEFEYSNPAFNGLALIIEKVTGQKWQQYISDLIFQPSGMQTSTITDGPHPESGVSHGYLYDGTKFYEKDYGEEPTFAAAGNGGVWSSVEELWKYEQAIQQHVFLDSACITRSRTIYPLPNWKGKELSHLGLCWFIHNTALGGIGHTGSQGGFRADYEWVPADKFFIVVLCNTPKPVSKLVSATYKIVTGQNPGSGN